jgi:biotin transport system substrate-specific component
MLLGLIGVPVFTAGGGLDYVFKPSFGYILSFPFAAFLTGSLKNRFRTLSVFKLFFCAFCGLLLNYTVGMTYQVFAVWLFVKSTLAAAFVSLTTLPFLFIKDAVMLYLVCLIYPRVTPLIGIESPPFEKKDNGEIAV